MQTVLDCIPCFQVQALRAARAAGASEQTQTRVLREVMRAILEADWGDTPVDLAMPVHQMVREITGVDDPFADDKRQATEAALSHLPELRRRIAGADCPLRMAVRIAIAGNIIDLGALEHFDLDETLERVSVIDFAIDHYEALHGVLEDADSVLLFADNAGEIVFDRLLLETIAERWAPRITLVVKSGPFIDRWIAEHDLTIAKGQADYEALSERKDVFFLLMAKCPCVAKSIGVNVGDIILRHGRR